MGANTFETKAKGKTSELAFRAAVDGAAWDYGHGGYTGTIAEKHSFVLIRDTPQSIAAKLPANEEELRHRLFSGDVTAIPEALICLGDPRINDKWGPAGCVEVTAGEYIFFGWASS